MAWPEEGKDWTERMSTRGAVLNGGHNAKHSSGSMFRAPLGFVVRPLEDADTGARSKNFEIIDLNENCSLEEGSGALEGG